MDTNLISYASQPNSLFFDWARETIASVVSEGGAAINAASQICAGAYRIYLERRNLESGGPIPKDPLPDFFIEAHSQLMGWPLATADVGRFQTYFPRVVLLTPDS